MKAKMFSKTRLNEFLAANGFKPTESFEAYGRKVMAYITTPDMAAREQLEGLLAGAGQKVNRSYWPGNRVVETQVTYFKAWHWNE